MKKRRFRPFLCQCCLGDPLRGRQIKGEAVEGFFCSYLFLEVNWACNNATEEGGGGRPTVGVEQKEV